MNEEFRKTAPAPLESVPFNVPTPFETILPNGLKIIAFEDRKLPLVSLRLVFFTGDSNDPQDLTGLTSAMASMLNEGTENYSSRELAEEIERLGAHIGANSSSDNTIVSASTLSLYLSDIIRLMAEIVLTPNFPEKELTLYKKNTIESLKLQRSQPNFLADEQISRILYGSHPYSIVSPTPRDIENLTVERLIEFHKQMFVPNNATFVVVGDFRREDLLKEIDSRFGNWQDGTTADREIFTPIERNSVTLTIVDRPGSAQSNIVLGNLALKRNHPDYFKALVMNQILGAGASSRIFMNLREEKGYTYGAYSSLDLRRLAGTFEATAEVRSAVTGDSLKEFFYELKRICHEKVTDQELQDAKNFLMGVFPIRAETQEGLTNLIVSQQIYCLPSDYLQTYREKISEITIDNVAEAANKYIQPDKLAMVIVGDAEEIIKQTKDYDPAPEVFDTNGNALDISKYGKPAEAPSVDVTGKWNLTLGFQGQEIPVAMSLKQKGGEISGNLETMFGEGKIEGGKISGNKVLAVACIQAQGQELELNINGTVEGDFLNGQISTTLLPVPLDFSGVKES